MPTKIIFTNTHYDLKSINPLAREYQEDFRAEEPKDVLKFFFDNRIPINSYFGVSLHPHSFTSFHNNEPYSTKVSIEKSFATGIASYEPLSSEVFGDLLEHELFLIEGKSFMIGRDAHKEFVHEKVSDISKFLKESSYARAFVDVQYAFGNEYTIGTLEQYFKTGEEDVLEPIQRPQSIEQYVQNDDDSDNMLVDFDEGEGGVNMESDNYIIGPDADNGNRNFKIGDGM